MRRMTQGVFCVVGCISSPGVEAEPSSPGEGSPEPEAESSDSDAESDGSDDDEDLDAMAANMHPEDRVSTSSHRAQLCCNTGAYTAESSPPNEQLSSTPYLMLRDAEEQALTLYPSRALPYQTSNNLNGRAAHSDSCRDIIQKRQARLSVSLAPLCGFST